MKKPILLHDLLKLIDINPPYFAFEELYWDNVNMYATIPVQQPLGNEIGPISAAEASRHLAILGVCSCAMQNPIKKRHYYLASRGIFERLSEAPCDPSTLQGRATCLYVDKKKAEAITELMDDKGNVIIRLRVFYHVIVDMVFERLYKEYHVEKPDFKLSNPYKYVHGFLSERFEGERMECSMGKIPEYYCAGHFPHYPALPVAILVYNLFCSASSLISTIEKREKSSTMVVKYEITADNLAFAGDDVELSVTRLEDMGANFHAMFAEGVANGVKSVAKINLLLKEVYAPAEVSSTIEYA